MKKICGAAVMAVLVFGGSGCIGLSSGYTADFQEVVQSAGDQVFPAVVYIHAVRGSLETGKDIANVVTGSGVIITPDGEVLTNYHVVDKAVTIRCLLNDGTACRASVVGSDKDIDLALLKLELPAETVLPFAALSDAEAVREGDFVMAMGAPWGLNRSVSIGIVSCASRYLPENGDYSLWYQTDAAISPGNSGGPLVDTRGKVIGINTLGMMGGGAIGFTIPVPTIRDILPRLREYGQVNWAWFGFQLQVLHDFDRNIYFPYDNGVIVSGTDPGSPARQAGFLPNDRIVAVGGTPETVLTREDMPRLKRRLGLMPFGEAVTFTVIRDGKEMEITAVPSPKGKVEGEEISCSRWGLTAKTINRFDVPNLYFYQNEGVYIYGVSNYGNAARTGLAAGDIILAINGEEIHTLAELQAAYDNAVAHWKTTSKATFTILRNGLTLQRVMDFSNDYDKE